MTHIVYRFQWCFGKKSNIKDEIDYAEEYMKDLDFPVSYCHNDLHHRNLMYDDETGKHKEMLYLFKHKKHSALSLEIWDLGIVSKIPI